MGRHSAPARLEWPRLDGMETPAKRITRLLDGWSRGDRGALDELMPLVHAELHKIARRCLARERSGHTLQPTALINEAYLKLVGERDMRWQNRAHFVGVAAQLMRFILVDHHRKKKNIKRGGDSVRVTFDPNLDVPAREYDDDDDDRFLALDAALTRLAAQDERKAKIAELKYFGDLSVEETAEALSVSTATVVREW